MKRWGKWLFICLLLLACKKRKEGNSYLFILSFDPLDYFNADDISSGTGLNVSSPISSAGDDTVTPGGATITTASGTGFVVSDSSSLITSPDSLDTEAYVNLNDSGRQAFISVAEQNINSCSGLGLFSSVTCSLGGFIIDIGAALSTASDLVTVQISGKNVDGDAVTSNALTAKLYKLRRVATVGSSVTDAQSFVVHDDKLFFNAKVGGTDSYLLSYDGADLLQVADLGGSQNDNAFPLVSYGGELLIRGNASGAAYNLMAYDGSTINKIIDLNSGAGDTIGNSVEFSSKLYTSIAAAGTSNIYRFDGDSFDQMTNDATNSSLVVAVADDGVYYFLDAAVSTSDGLYRLNSSALIPNRKVTDNSFDHSASEYFVLNGKLYFTANYGSTDQTFMVDGDTVKRVASFAMTGISVYNNVAYGIINEGGLNNLYRYTGSIFERLNPDSIRLSQDPVSTPILATASGVYFVRDPDTSTGDVNELFRYNARRFERLFSMEKVASNASTQRLFEFNDEIYFTAYTGAQGTLYKLELIQL